MTRYRGGREWASRRGEALTRDGYRCTRCGTARRLEVHHIVHWARGGGDELANLTTLCYRCHIEAHRRPATAGERRWAKLLREVGE